MCKDVGLINLRKKFSNKFVMNFWDFLNKIEGEGLKMMSVSQIK